MSQLDGILLGKVDTKYDWVSSLSSGGPFENLIWDSVGKDENNVEHFINKINCRYNEENGQAWWVQRCRTSDNGFEYLLCHSYADSNIVFIEATKTLSDPERKALRPDRYNLKTHRLHGESLASAINSGGKLSPFDEAFNQTTIWGRFDGYENEYPYVDFGLGVHTVNLNKSKDSQKQSPQKQPPKAKRSGLIKKLFSWLDTI